MRARNIKKIIFLLFAAAIIVSCVDEHVVNPQDNNAGTIKLTSQPDGAEIFLLGESTNKFTPDSISGLESGPYEVTLKRNEFYDSTFTVNVYKNRTTAKNVILRKVIFRGSVFLESEPEGANIFLQNNNTEKVTPDSIGNLPVGIYSVTLKLQNYYDSTFTLSVLADQTTSKKIILEEEDSTGNLFIQSTPPEAEIYLDGVSTQKFTPDSLTNLIEGEYELTLKLEGYADTTFTAEVLREQTNSYSIDLEQITGNLFIESEPAGASIYLNDSLTGKISPDTLTLLEEGIYDITLKLQGFKDTTFSAEVFRGETNSLFISLSQTTSGGKIVLNSEPEGAQIFLDETFTEKLTPDSLVNLESGLYAVTLKLDGFRDTTTTVLLFQNSREFRFIALTDTLPAVGAQISYRTNQFGQLIFTFRFNQDILLDRIEIKKPTEDEFQTSNFNNSLIRKNVPVDFSFPEKIPGIWIINFYGAKAAGVKEEFELRKQVLVL